MKKPMIQLLLLVLLPAIIAALEGASIYYCFMYHVTAPTIILLVLSCAFMILDVIFAVGYFVGVHYQRVLRAKQGNNSAHTSSFDITKSMIRNRNIAIAVLIVSLCFLVITFIVGGKEFLNIIAYVTAM